MRARLWLPLIQMVAMLLILWAPWAPQTHQLQIKMTSGAELRTWTLIPGANALAWAEGMNLPAAAVVTAIEFAIRRGGDYRNVKVMFFGLWVLGLLCWYMVGRFVDDLGRWQRRGELPPKHGGDLAFALVALPSAALLALAFTIGGVDSPVIAAWGPLWVVAITAALLFRVMQFIRQHRRARIS
jgi:hypothetical protein